MKKRIGRRLVSLLLTFVTVLTMLPAMTLPALAASSEVTLKLAEENIDLRFSGTADNAWKAGGNQIEGHAQSTSKWFGLSQENYTSTLTITNKKNAKATLSFDYTVVLSDGKIEVNETKVTADGTFTTELASDASIKVYIESGSTKAETKITMTNVTLVSADTTAAVTFLPAENGSYTVDGKPFTEEYTNTQSAATAYRLVATPYEGYRFIGWYDVTHGRYINANATTALKFDSDCIITARFGSIDLALFETNGLNFDNLSEAVIEAKKNPPATITLVSDGKITGTYTIPSGVTLLIPFDEAKTLYEETPTTTRTISETKPFRTLTMTANSSITLEKGAAISVGGQYFASQGGQSGRMVGPYGYIKMESGSAITVQGGASLYAWGFISGSGSVTVESGGTVYEWYQILDFRGGFATISIQKGVFPLSQYTVQNVEVPLTVHAGASETVYTAVLADGTIYPTPIQFIGNKGMFKLISGSLTKTYDGSTDRLIYTINGEAEVNSLSLKLAGVGLDSSKYVLPFTSNMTVVLKSDSKLTMNQTAALLPSVSVTIEKNAELVVPKNQSMYIYDVDQWGNYCFGSNGYVKSVSVPYAPGKTGKRAPLTDAKVDVNGKLTAIGSVYTTESGADICSSEGGGRFVQQNAPGQETTTYQVTKQASLKPPTTTKYYDIPITPAKLHNANGSYIETNKTVAKAGDTFTYCKGQECGGTWVKNLQVAAIIDSTGTPTPYPTLQDAVGAYEPDDNTAPKNYIKLLHSTTEEINAQSDLYLDLNGCTVTGNFTMNSKTLYGMDSSVKGYNALPKGKIVGSVVPYAKTTYQTPPTENKEYDRYVAIQGKEGTTSTLSFHRFNISVTGYRFELATGGTPQCALFFIGKFQGDAEAKKHLTKLGFTLTDIDDTEKKYGCTITGKTIPLMPTGGGTSTSEVVQDAEGAYFFEAYLMRSFDKNNADTYKKTFSAIAQATFDNGTQDSDPKWLSFWDAWTDPNMDTDQKTILKNFLDGLDTTN